MKPKVSIIIPTKNEEENIARCLKSLQSQDYSPIEVIVVDNHSSDKTRKIAKTYTDKVFTKGPERSAQRNFGARKATGEILFFIDADMTLDQKVVSQATELLETEKAIEAIIVPEKTVGENYWARVRALERNCYLGEKNIEAARVFDRDTFFKLGGFDENLVAAEDWDLTQRIAKLGKISRTKTKVIHYEGTLSIINHLKKKYYYAQDIHLYAQKHQEKFKTQAGLARLSLFVRNWRKLAADPIHALGVFILKSLEYFIFISAKLR